MANENTMNLSNWGWNPFFAEHFARCDDPELIPARVVQQNRGFYVLRTEHGEILAGVTGRAQHQAAAKTELPGVGDWVGIRQCPGESKATIHRILPRKSVFVRKVADGPFAGQVIAANIDTVFVVCGLDGGRNFNLRRIERYLAAARESGAKPVIVLNKLDLCEDPEARLREAQSIASDAPVHAVSATQKIGIKALRSYLGIGQTTVFIGPSGVGKSALVNALVGNERQVTGEVRATDLQGRHTTTRSDLILLPGGGAIIDTPGMRKFQVWSDSNESEAIFEDIENLATQCRFRDCRHNREPGCAVQKSVSEGILPLARFENYQRLHRETKNMYQKRAEKARLLQPMKKQNQRTPEPTLQRDSDRHEH